MSSADEDKLVNYQYTEELWSELENSQEALVECWDELQEARRLGKGSIGGPAWIYYRNRVKEVLYFLGRQWDCAILPSLPEGSAS